MARMAYSLSVPSHVLEEGLHIELVPVREVALPSLAEITAPRGFVPDGLSEQPTAPATGPILPGAVFAAPRGFLPERYRS